MNRMELQLFLFKQGIKPPNPMVADVEYALPEVGWLFSSYAKAFTRLLNQFKVNDWTTESFDCDNFARLGSVFAQILHHKTGVKPNSALAVGEFWYKDDERGLHAIMAAVVNIDGDRTLVFMEPQDQSRKKLSQQEIQSCTAYAF